MLGFAALCASCRAASVSNWTLVKSEHFEVYSQRGGETARSALLWFEQLRAFTQQSGLKFQDRPAVRVIGFASTKEYDAYRLRPTSDAYYLGTESRDYIVMPSLSAENLGVAAHEYAHSFLHDAGLRLPPWLAEGLAEFFSTIRLEQRGSSIGGELPAHSQTLQRREWIPLPELLARSKESQSRDSREDGSLFYAQSWELTQMLALSPEYSPRFGDLIQALNSGIPSSKALTDLYGKPLAAIASDAHRWAGSKNIKPIMLPSAAGGNVLLTSAELSPFAWRSILAELLLATGELDRAEVIYSDLSRTSPDDPDVSAALGAIALGKGDRGGAQRQWKRAMEQGVDDAGLCYRFAVLAEEQGLAVDDLRSALERAIKLKPDFDDARYKLALLENNAGRYEIALAQFKAMRSVTPARAYGYWTAMAYAFNELGRREEAKTAAAQAATFAATPSERANAAQLAYIAQTDLAVRFTHDASGHAQLVTTRVPHGTSDWNPFIEAEDQMRRAEGQLRSIECADNKVTGIAIQTAGGLLTVSIPDPSHVLMRNAPAEFTCGPQSAAVVVDYAVRNKDGVLRGMEFR